MSSEVHPVEVIGQPGRPGPFLFTCEHASNRLPAEFSAGPREQQWLQEHWGWDLGARDVTASLVELFGGRGICSPVSRLVVDLNRATDDPAYISEAIGGEPVGFNAVVDATEQKRRTRLYDAPFRAAVDSALRSAPAMLLSVHSYTPVYLGQRRAVEVGVLFDAYDELAEPLCEALSAAGFDARLNEPYSGKPPHNLIYSAKHHGDAHGVPYLELEVRQDLIATPAAAAAVALRIAPALASLQAARAS